MRMNKEELARERAEIKIPRQRRVTGEKKENRALPKNRELFSRMLIIVHNMVNYRGKQEPNHTSMLRGFVFILQKICRCI